MKPLLILQIALSLSLLLLTLSDPFMGKNYRAREQLFLTKTVRGDLSLLTYVTDDKLDIEKSTLLLNATLYAKLPLEKKEAVEKLEAQAEKILHRSYLQQLSESFEKVIHLPPLVLGWISLSFVLSILLLKNVAGAAPASWLLPLIALAYLFTGAKTESTSLYPSEEALFIYNDLSTPEKFQEAFHLYLRDKYGENAEFSFNLHRVEVELLEKQGKSSPPLLLYFAWNLLFAYIVNKNDKTTQKHPLDRTYHPLH